MKKILLFAALLSVVGLNMPSCRAQEEVKMQAMFSYSTFYLAEQQSPYVETYLSFDAWTMAFKEQENGSYRATAEVTIALKQGDSLCYAKKYDLGSPTVGSLDEVDFSFLDVQRFAVKNGIYDLELRVRDLGRQAPESVVREKVAISYDSRHPSMSSVLPVSEATPTESDNPLSRNGYDMEPYVSDYYPASQKLLRYYYEIYNIEREVGVSPFLTVAYVEEQATGRRYEGQANRMRQQSASMVPVYGALDIEGLPSGSYNLVVEARNSKNELMLYKKLPFYRSNPDVAGGHEISDFATTFVGIYTDERQLDTYLESLYPLASTQERQVVSNLTGHPGLEEKQAFLYAFWQKRSPLDPEGEWLKYKERVDYVMANFSYVHTKGINTDRGRVYLTYGPPDFVRDEKNFTSVKYLGAMVTSAANVMQQTGTQDEDQFSKPAQGQIFYLPYQLWRYNKLDTDDPNRVFLFWDEHRSGLYRLLHSNARGEVQDPGWERRLCRQQLPENTVGEVGEQFNRGY